MPSCGSARPSAEIIAVLSGIRALRVTAQLIDAETDSHLWAEKYSGGMEDVCATQEEIAREIVSALQVQLTDAESRVVAQRPIDDPAAYDCYLRAQHEIYASPPRTRWTARRNSWTPGWPSSARTRCCWRRRDWSRGPTAIRRWLTWSRGSPVRRSR